MTEQDILEKIGENQDARLMVSTRRGLPALHCFITYDPPNTIFLSLLPDQISALTIDPKSICVMFFTIEEVVYSINARIERILDETGLELKPFVILNHPQKRRHFRVDTEVFMQFWTLEENAEAPDRLSKEEVNLSASGVRFVQNLYELREGQIIGLGMILPNSNGKLLEMTGRVVRVKSKGKAGQEAAVEFVDIRNAVQDKIFQFCFSEQRRQLRHKVQVLGTT